MGLLKSYTRHRCFVSYHHADELEVRTFIELFDHGRDVLISRGIGASMPGDVLDSNESTYIMRRVRDLYLNDATVTIVLVGRCTWTRKYVDWEVAASLRNSPNSRRNGLLAITLPSIADDSGRQLPPRVADNVSGEEGYARWWKCPSGAAQLARYIQIAYDERTARSHLVDNARTLYSYNRTCT